MSQQINVLSTVLFSVIITLLISGAVSAASVPEAVETCIDVAPVWSGHPVGFSLLTTRDKQFVGFYDAERKLTVASRELSESSWHFVKLPETLGWDSHNSIVMAADDDGCIHLCANMHAVPLKYFRTSKSWDIDSFERINSMVGKDETRCTYPQFFRGPGNSFNFTYRSGGSGNGDQFYNTYDHKTKTWKRLMDKPFTSGEGQMNAYLSPLCLGPDGYYHIAWVWRDHGGCESNHDVSYARSKDLVHWETAADKPVALPIVLKTADVVDPVPAKGGLINGNVHVGFDSKKRTIVSYHKFDENGFTQIYNARFENGNWKIYRTSDWKYRWDFSGGGSIPFEIGLSAVKVEKDGKLSQSYSHDKYGKGKWILDESTLKPTGDSRQPELASDDPSKIANSEQNKLQLRTCGDSGSSHEPGVKYTLRWETLGVNRDRPHEGTAPPPSMLRLCREKGK